MIGDSIRSAPGNLIAQIPRERVVRPAGYFQFFFLDFISIGSAAALGFAYKTFLAGGGMIFLLTALVIFLVITAFGLLLQESFSRRCMVVILETAASLAFFWNSYAGHAPFFITAGVVLVVLRLWGELRSRSERSNGLALKFFRVTRPGIKKTITALALSAILIVIPQWTGTPVVSRPYFDSIFSAAAAISKQFYAEIAADGTIGQFAHSVADYQLKGNQDFARLPYGEQEEVRQSIVVQVESKISGYLGIKVSSDDRISDILYRFIGRTIGGWQERSGTWFTVIWGVIVFLAFRSIGELIWWIAAALSYALYQMLLAANVLQMRGEAVMRESVEFSS